MKMKLLKGSLIVLACVFLGACSTQKVYDEQAIKQIQSKGVSFDPASFISAAGKGDLETVKLFIQAGMDINVYYSSTALSSAASNKQIEVVKYLLANGADPNISTFYGSTLAAAAKSNSPEIVDMLLDAGANPNSMSSDGHSALSVASFVGNAQIVSALIRAGAKVDYLHPVTGATPLSTAVYYGKKDSVEALIKGGANVNYVDNRGMSILDWSQIGSNNEITKLLIENGANIESDKKTKGVGKVMITALAHEDVDMIKYLVQKGVDPNGKAFGKMPLLVWCAKNGLQKSGMTLIQLGANVKAIDPVSGSSALDYAIANGEVDLAKAIDPSVNTKLIAANAATDPNLRTQQQIIEDYVSDQYYQSGAQEPVVNFMTALTDTAYTKDKAPEKLTPLFQGKDDLAEKIDSKDSDGTSNTPAVKDLESVLTTQLSSDTDLMAELRNDPIFKDNTSIKTDSSNPTVQGLDDSGFATNDPSFDDFDAQIAQDLSSINQSLKQQPPADTK